MCPPLGYHTCAIPVPGCARASLPALPQTLQIHNAGRLIECGMFWAIKGPRLSVAGACNQRHHTWHVRCAACMAARTSATHHYRLRTLLITCRHGSKTFACRRCLLAGGDSQFLTTRGTSMRAHRQKNCEKRRAAAPTVCYETLRWRIHMTLLLLAV